MELSQKKKSLGNKGFLCVRIFFHFVCLALFSWRREREGYGERI